MPNLYAKRGLEFEYEIQDFFASRDFNIFETPTSHDYGADLILYYKGQCIVIQCKNTSGLVGISAVQEVIGAVSYYGGDIGMVISVQPFTPSARKLAASNNIILVGGSQLEKLLQDVTGEIKYMDELLAHYKHEKCPRQPQSFWGRVKAILCH